MSSEKLAARVMAHEILLKSILAAVPRAYLHMIASEASTHFAVYQRGAASRDEDTQHKVVEARQIAGQLLGKPLE